MKKYLTEELFKKLCELQPKRPTIIDCLAKCNTFGTDSVGVVALNASCYTIFADLFESIIQEINCVDVDAIASKYPDTDWNGDTMAFPNFESESILGIEISCARSLMNVPFVCGANENDLQAILTTVSAFSYSEEKFHFEIDCLTKKISGSKCHTINASE